MALLLEVSIAKVAPSKKGPSRRIVNFGGEELQIEEFLVLPGVGSSRIRCVDLDLLPCRLRGIMLDKFRLCLV